MVLLVFFPFTNGKSNLPQFEPKKQPIIVGAFTLGVDSRKVNSAF